MPDLDDDDLVEEPKVRRRRENPIELKMREPIKVAEQLTMRKFEEATFACRARVVLQGARTTALRQPFREEDVRVLHGNIARLAWWILEPEKARQMCHQMTACIKRSSLQILRRQEGMLELIESLLQVIPGVEGHIIVLDHVVVEFPTMFCLNCQFGSFVSPSEYSEFAAATFIHRITWLLNFMHNAPIDVVWALVKRAASNLLPDAMTAELERQVLGKTTYRTRFNTLLNRAINNMFLENTVQVARLATHPVIFCLNCT